MQRFVLDTVNDNSKELFFQRSFLMCSLSIACSLMAANGHAQQSAETTALKPVVVNGRDAAVNQSTAAKVIVTQDDLTRFGDTTVGDALKRVPGVSVSGVPGRGGEIRMRGLGNGYTQVLLNGQPTAPGFSLDSIAPNLIERIEIVRSATADQSAQSIAGTVNIILKRTISKRQRTIKFSAASENDEPAFNLDVQQSDKIDTTGYSVAANLKSQKYHNNWKMNQTVTEASAQPQSIVAHSGREQSEAYTASFTPRVTWQLNEHDNLIGDGFISYQRSIYENFDDKSFPLGTPTLYGDSDFSQHFSYVLTSRAGVTFSREFADAATLETKLTLNANRRRFTNYREFLLPGESFDDDVEPSLQRRVDSQAADKGFASTGKYRLPFRDKHALTFGWDAESSRRDEYRLQDEFVALVAPPENLDEDFSAQVYRFAFFGQGDWEVTKTFSAYTGLRWEGLRTESDGNEFDTVSNQSSVLSPSVQLLWKIPDTKKDQLRAGIARTYKAPATRDLIARRFRTDDNTPTSPDGEGNPDLRPETAWGLDIGYEHQLLESISLNTNVFTRRIDDVIQPQLSFDGRWVTHLVNKGRAYIRGIEIELKTALRDIDKRLAAIELRANLNRNWSSVDDVPGSDNRLVNQEIFNSNIGADWKIQRWPLTLGGNYGFKKGSTARTAVDVQTWTDSQHLLDFYALWKIDKIMQLRFSGSNLLAQDIIRGDDYFADNTLSQRVTIYSARVFRLGLEMTL